MRALERLTLTRVVAQPSAIDRIACPRGANLLRVAADEALLTGELARDFVDDPHALVENERGFFGIWLQMTEAQEFLMHSCGWESPAHRPALAQGSVAGIPAKVWFEKDRVLFLVPSPFAADFAKELP